MISSAPTIPQVFKICDCGMMVLGAHAHMIGGFCLVTVCNMCSQVQLDSEGNHFGPWRGTPGYLTIEMTELRDSGCAGQYCGLHSDSFAFGKLLQEVVELRRDKAPVLNQQEKIALESVRIIGDVLTGDSYLSYAILMLEGIQKTLLQFVDTQNDSGINDDNNDSPGSDDDETVGIPLPPRT